MRSRLLPAALLAAAALFGCGPRGTAPLSADAPAPPLTREEEAGLTVYRRENCARCHTLFDGPRGSGPADLPAPPPPTTVVSSRVGPDLGLEGHRRSDDWHLAHLYAPDIVVPGSRMPPARHLFRSAPGGLPEPDQDARALVLWLQSLGRGTRDVWAEFRSREPEIPPRAAVPDAGRLERGTRLYTEHCAACHGDAGDGNGPAAALLAPRPRNFVAAAYRFRSNGPWDPPRDADLFRAITLGTGIGAAMPAFYFLSAEDRWALVARIKSFSPALSRGGPDTGGAPVAPHAAGAAATSPARGVPPGDGRALWDSLGCARCHGDDGSGRTATETRMSWLDAEGLPVDRSGDLRHACSRRGGGSDEAFDRAIRRGVGAAMPSFGEALEGRPDAAHALRTFLETVAAGDGAATR